MADDVFAEADNYRNIIDTVAEDGRGTYSRETLDQVRARYPTAARVSFEAWRAEAARRQDTPITWTPITEERYSEMLDVLPPMDWDAYGFLVCEACDHSYATGQPRYSAFRQRGNLYEESARPITRAEFRAIKAERITR